MSERPNTDQEVSDGVSNPRALVCGGRTFDDWRLLRDTLQQIRPALIINGGASGADQLATRWAHHDKVPVCEFPANWRFAGRAAGPLRNQAMIDFAKPDLVVAFPGGRGTADMVRRAREAGITVVEPKRPA